MRKRSFTSWGNFTTLALLFLAVLYHPVTQSTPSLLRATPITENVQDNGLRLASTPVSGPQPYVTILCRFADSTGVTPHPKSWYQTLMGSSYPGMDHYWREVSYNAVNLTGSVVVGWYNLPQPRSYYINDNQALLEDCTAVADTEVFFPNFIGISMWVNDTIVGGAGSMFLNRDGQNKAYKLIWTGTEDEAQGNKAQGGLAHEMGHTLGLPHTSGIDIMNGWFGSIHPTYGQVAVHTNAFHKDLLGWLPVAKKYVAIPGSQPIITLERLALPQTNNYLMAQVPINKPDIDFYTIEARHFAGYDQSFDGGAGVLIHKVKMFPCLDLNSFPSEIVPRTVGGRLHWEPGETFIDATNQVTITINSATPTGYAVTISYLPNLTQKVYLPQIVGGISTTPVPLLCVTSVQTSDENGNPKSTFAPGDSISYDGTIVNPTPIALMANLNWSVIGSCGPILSSATDMGIGSGTGIFPNLENIPANACAGNYTYTLSVTYNGVTSSKSTTFTVMGQ